MHCEDGGMLERSPEGLGALLPSELSHTQLDKAQPSLNFEAILQMPMNQNRRNCTSKQR